MLTTLIFHETLILVSINVRRLVFKMDSLAKEILGIAFPSALAVAADPIASLIDTAFIGHLGTFSCQYIMLAPKEIHR